MAKYLKKFKIQIQANYFVLINVEERHHSIADRRFHLFTYKNCYYWLQFICKIDKKIWIVIIGQKFVDYATHENQILLYFT